MSCTDAANDRNNALLHNDEVPNAKVLDLSFGAYMNSGRWNHNSSRITPLVQALLAAGFAVQLSHDPTEKGTCEFPRS